MKRKQALILGGNRFFGKHLAQSLLKNGYEVTLLNRGQQEDGLGPQVHRIKADRKIRSKMEAALGDKTWDLVFDQICFTAGEARTICELLERRTKRILFTSSQSVYRYGLNIREEAFDPISYHFSKNVASNEDYAEAKRQAETEFAKFPHLKPVMVRMPLVVGSDDHTGRLLWHVQRCKNRLPIYFPNEKARLGFIRSDMAGEALLKIAESDLLGPVNCACPGSIELAQLMEMIEQKTGKSSIRASESNIETHSPFGIGDNWTMDLKKLTSRQIEFPNLKIWMPDLLSSLSQLTF